jgi:hypothetical protein
VFVLWQNGLHEDAVGSYACLAEKENMHVYYQQRVPLGRDFPLPLPPWIVATLKGSKTQTWEGGLRVPGIVWWPEAIHPQVRHEVASTLDVFATICEAVNAPLPTDRAYDSVSLLPLLTSESATPPRKVSFFYAGAFLNAVRMGAYKAHLITQAPNEPHAGPERGFLNQSGSDHSPYGAQDPWLLFNVEHDPGELHAISPTSAVAEEILPAIAAAIKAHRASIGQPPPGVLSHTCAVNPSDPSTDCRICCDHSKNCVCNPPPAGVGVMGMVSHGIVGGAFPTV